MSAKSYFVYILTNKNHTTLYVGVTSDLAKRIWEHRHKIHQGFTYKYDTAKLVYYEMHVDVIYAITREKSIKRWRREWKEALIDEMNPGWEDLYGKIKPGGRDPG